MPKCCMHKTKKQRNNMRLLLRCQVCRTLLSCGHLLHRKVLPAPLYCSSSLDLLLGQHTLRGCRSHSRAKETMAKSKIDGTVILPEEEPLPRLDPYAADDNDFSSAVSPVSSKLVLETVGVCKVFATSASFVPPLRALCRSLSDLVLIRPLPPRGLLPLLRLLQTVTTV